MYHCKTIVSSGRNIIGPKDDPSRVKQVTPEENIGFYSKNCTSEIATLGKQPEGINFNTIY